ncbi:MAG: rhomboid family intramembrane serine protease [Candidatus Eremiobacteraeota bacterium]|nr:rhomboid family intramembrane serine protease [Candidatus Eremiobacteraeota bacterium]MCW5866635.1 rhomboid family intramembrane serine protease [Candidatus Eremiobacteraeota bacterium]
MERRFYPVRATWVLLALLLLAALLGGVSTDVAELRRLGARPPLYGFHPRPQHLLAPLFLHGGWVHFGCNFLSLSMVGAALEIVLGSLGLIYVFFFAGIASLSASFLANPQVTSLGCSGAVFGIWAARVVHCWCPPREEERFRFVALFIFSVLLTIVPARMGVNVDHVGHFAGMLGGVIACLAFRVGGVVRWGALLALLGWAGWVARPPWSPF